MTNPDYKNYKRTNRRLLLDSHIPDWEDDFLSKFDAAAIAENYKIAGVQSAMVYTQSHIGFCYWPVKTGDPHPALKQRDFVEELLCELGKRNISAFGYYSGIFNNRAYLEHPEWRITPRPDMSGGAFFGKRYGHVCPNNSEYRSFMKTQLTDLLQNHQFEGFFIDMTFWPGICQCDSCKSKYKAETGNEIPQTIDWNNPEWCRFQSLREQWLLDYASFVNDAIHSVAPGLPIYHNFAVGLFNWRWGVKFDIRHFNTFLGGDFYGSPDEQYLMSRLMINLSENQPFEFMTSRCNHLTDHIENRSMEQLQIQAFASLATNSSFLVIDAINPDGSVDDEYYIELKKIYDRLAEYDFKPGGEPVEDVAVYISDNSKINYNENGWSIKDNSKKYNSTTHLKAVEGAVTTLKEKHYAVGVITNKQLDELNRYPVIVLPSVTRLTTEESVAFREFVSRGGHLYASGITSLNTPDGHQPANFMLSDVFGLSFDGEWEGELLYFRPIPEIWKDSPTVQKLLTQRRNANGNEAVFKVKAISDAKVLANITLPYGFPSDGAVDNKNWSSIHSSPAHDNTEFAAIVEHSFGKGKVIYSTSDIESSSLISHRHLFSKLIKRLLPEKPRFETLNAHPDIWVMAFHYPKENCYLLNVLNFPDKLPAYPHRDVKVVFREAENENFINLSLDPQGASIPMEVNNDFELIINIPEFRHFVRIRIDYKKKEI